MIASFKCKDTEGVFDGYAPAAFPPDILQVARRKLRMLAAAINLNDLRQPPGNRLEKLDKEPARIGQHSIRVNDQWRICFEWIDGAAHNVELTKHYK